MTRHGNRVAMACGLREPVCAYPQVAIRWQAELARRLIRQDVADAEGVVRSPQRIAGL